MNDELHHLWSLAGCVWVQTLIDQLDHGQCSPVNTIWMVSDNAPLGFRMRISFRMNLAPAWYLNGHSSELT